MPNYAGYELVNFFDEVNFEIIFITAYDQYAIKAFELSAVDYLLKPIDRKRLDTAVQKAIEKIQVVSSVREAEAFIEAYVENNNALVDIGAIQDVS